MKRQKLQNTELSQQRKKNKQETESKNVVIDSDTVRSIGSLVNTARPSDIILFPENFDPTKIIFRKNDIIGVYFGKQSISDNVYRHKEVAPYGWTEI